MVCTIGLSTTGCKKKEDDKKPPKEGGGQAAAVTYEVENKAVTVKQGESADIKVKRSGTDLKDAQLGVDSSEAKLKATGGEFKGDKKTTTVHIKAAADAPPGEAKVTLKAGEWTDTVTVTVEKAKAKEETPAAKIEYKLADKTVTLKQGDSKEVTITRKGTGLKDLTLDITSSDPKVTVTGGKFKGDGTEATLKITVAKDAAAKDHTVTIKAGDTTLTIDVKVEKAKGAMNFRPQRDRYLAAGREGFQMQAQTVTRRPTVWFTREF
jgi:hypothetical protein